MRFGKAKLSGEIKVTAANGAVANVKPERGSTRFRVTHNTTYEYNNEVGRCYNLAQMMPRDTYRQTCIKSKVRITPTPAHSNKRQDYFGNTAYFFAIQRSHNILSIETESEVVVNRGDQSPGLDFGLSCAEAKDRIATSKEEDVILAREYLLDSPMIKANEELRRYAQPLFANDRPLLAAARELTQKIYKEFAYDPGFTTIATPLQDVLAHKRGVCQDFAHLAIGCLRSLGFPARYVSGYLETLPPPGQEKLVGADATHAWLAVFSPGEGWFEFDPTNDAMAGEQHIVTAWGRDYSDVTPLRGVIFGGGDSNKLSVAVTVERI